MPNKYSDSKLVDLYVRAGLEGRSLPEIRLRGKELEALVDSLVDEMNGRTIRHIAGDPSRAKRERGRLSYRTTA